ncbi:hypothetical protein lerEdw1_004628 [Lerista edwardsae]|nr:hypothetical protein lerEdw1_004628 [Lerista edwardsae]
MQPQRSVSALRGTDFTLECSVSNNEHLAGPVKWFMGKGPTRKPVYSATTPSDRVTRTEPGSDSDFSISIHNAAPEDVGTYYCVKQRTVLGGEVDWRSGAGTELAVRDDILPAVVGTVCILLAVLISVALYIYVKKKRGKKGCSSRSEGPSSENTGTPHQVG